MLTLRISPIVKTILIVTVILFFIEQLLRVNLTDKLGLVYIFSKDFHFFQFFSHIFLHADLNHLLCNLFALYMFGPTLEQEMGPRKFIVFYFIIALGAATLYSYIHYMEVQKIETLYHNYLSNPIPENFYDLLPKAPIDKQRELNNFSFFFAQNPNKIECINFSKKIVSDIYYAKANRRLIGASGPIFGILTAFSMLFPDSILYFFLLPIPIKAKYFIVLYGIYELYKGLQNNPTDNIAHFAHLGGIAFGYLFIKIFKKKYYLK